MTDVLPHVARRVRDKTLSTTNEAKQKIDRIMGEYDLPHRSKSKFVNHATSDFYRLYKKRGLAISKILYLPRKKNEKWGLVGHWDEVGGVLYGFYYMFIPINQENQGVLLGPKIRVSRHAIERVSERLGTINPQEIKNELSPAVSSLAIYCGSNWDARRREYYAKTQHGIAIAVSEGDDQTITTWVSDELTRSDQRSILWKPYRTQHGKTRIIVESSAEAPIFKVVRID